MLTSYFCLLLTVSQKRAENRLCATRQGLFCVSAASSTCHSWSFEQKSAGWLDCWEWKEKVSSNAKKGISQLRDTQKLQWTSEQAVLWAVNWLVVSVKWKWHLEEIYFKVNSSTELVKVLRSAVRETDTH